MKRERSTRAVTIKDVARAAGVSPATVSVVINGSAPRLRIADATQARVREAAEQLGYVADPRVQALRRGQTRTVLMAFVTRQVPDAFFVDILHALDREAAERNRDAQFHLVREAGGWEQLRSAAKAAAGVILTGSPPPHQTAPLRALPVPLVQVGSGEPLPGAAVVRVDNRLAGRLVGEHLLALGHRDIAIVGPRHWYAPFVERRDGLLETLEAGGAATPLSLSAPEPDHETIAQLKAARVSAVVCLYDRLALALLREARLAGVRVPADWSVASFDDMDWSALLAPSLTTVRIPRTRMAAAAMRQLEALLDGAESLPHHVITPELIERESTAPRTQ